MMKEHIASCCGDDSTGWRPLNAGQRRSRLVVGVALLLLALAPPWSAAGWIALSVIVGWIGTTHVLAAAMAYPGCPELGAAPSLLLGRWVKISCSSWRWLDARFRLTAR